MTPNVATYDVLKYLQRTLVSDNGLKFSGRFRFPFLKIGVTWALVQSSGTMPVSRDCWKIRVRIGAISIYISHNILQEMSGAEAFLIVSLHNTFSFLHFLH